MTERSGRDGKRVVPSPKRKIEWYRRTDWSAEVESDFEARLARSRGQRPQYLCIQGLELINAGGEQRIRKGLELIERYLSTYADHFDRGPAHKARAKGLIGLGDVDGAFEAYRMSCQTQRLRPNIGTDAYLDFGFLAITRKRQDLYAEAERLLDEFGGRGSAPFPVQQYKHYAVRAVVSDWRGERGAARSYARLALEAASKKTSGFRYHADLGLVTHTDTLLHVELTRLARAT